MATVNIFDMADTWNNVATTYTAIKMNVTDTASASGSLLMDLQVGGASAFNVSKGGSVKLGINSSGTNVAGTNVTISGSQGTGSGAGGSIIFQVAPAGSSGTAQNALFNALSIEPTSAFGGTNGVILRLGSEMFMTYDEDNSLLIRRQNSSLFGVSMGSRGGGAAAALGIGASTVLAWASANQPDGDSTFDVILARDAANTLALRNSTNAQTFNVYNTYTDASNYERGFVKWDTNALKIGTEKLGTGSARALEFQTDGTTRVTIATGGAISFNGDISTVGSVTVGAAEAIIFSGRSRINSAANGNIHIRNNAGTDFGLLQFGGTTSSFPALKRSTTSLQVRLADDSGYTNIQGKITTETAYTAGAPTATGYIVLYDSTGTAYKVPAEAL